MEYKQEAATATTPTNGIVFGFEAYWNDESVCGADESDAYTRRYMHNNINMIPVRGGELTASVPENFYTHIRARL